MVTNIHRNKQNGQFYNKREHEFSNGCGDNFCPGCNMCNLDWCVVCQSGESELTSECCGISLTRERREAVSVNELDYIEGKWISPQAPYSPLPKALLND